MVSPFISLVIPAKYRNIADGRAASPEVSVEMAFPVSKESTFAISSNFVSITSAHLLIIRDFSAADVVDQAGCTRAAFST